MARPQQRLENLQRLPVALNGSAVFPYTPVDHPQVSPCIAFLKFKIAALSQLQELFQGVDCRAGLAGTPLRSCQFVQCISLSGPFANLPSRIQNPSKLNDCPGSYADADKPFPRCEPTSNSAGPACSRKAPDITDQSRPGEHRAPPHNIGVSPRSARRFY
jgi:hypothetical protein